jgi:hypothetical protein
VWLPSRDLRTEPDSERGLANVPVCLGEQGPPTTYEIRASPDLVYKHWPILMQLIITIPTLPPKAMRLSSYTHFILFFLGALVSAVPVRPSALSLLALD